MKGEIFIHVGMPRTGTKFLQKEVFPRLNGVKYLNYDLPYLFSITNENIKGKVLYSHEVLSYSFLRQSMARNLSKCFPDARIIFCIRDFNSFKRSMYGMKLSGGYTHDYEYYMKQRLQDSDREIRSYAQLLRKLFPEVLIYHFEDFKDDVDGYVRVICDFIGCDVPIFNNKKYNRSVPSHLWYRWLTFNKLFPKKIFNPLHHIGRYLLK